MKFKERTVAKIADMICGDFKAEESYFPYRSSFYITRFFRDCDTDYEHDGSTRARWVTETLKQILDEPQVDAITPPETFSRVIRLLMDVGDGRNDTPSRDGALGLLNAALATEGFEAFYADDKQCYLRHVATNTIAAPVNPHRPFSPAEVERRVKLLAYLDEATEDELIEDVLLPLFRQLGFHRITNAGHKDKQLEYGKDIWMKYTLPTQHVLYFGIQAKRAKLDSSGNSDSNVAEILNQVTMMLGHEVFDAEIGKRVLVDHAFIVAGGEITKAARNWLGGRLDAIKRSQVMFMDREDILNLYVVTNLPLPAKAVAETNWLTDNTFDEIPF